MGLRQRANEIQSFQILINDQYIFFALFVSSMPGLQVISFGTAVNGNSSRVSFSVVLLFLVFIEQSFDIQLPSAIGLIEVVTILKSQSLDGAHHGSFIVFHLPVLNFAFRVSLKACWRAISFNAWRILVRALEVVTMFNSPAWASAYSMPLSPPGHRYSAFVSAGHSCHSPLHRYICSPVCYGCMERKIEHRWSLWQV